jgi:hypothetical protein
MPNQRNDRMKAISISMDAELLALIETARKQLRVDRSTFIRIASLEKMRRLGMQVDDDLQYPPDLRLNETPPEGVIPISGKAIPYREKRPKKTP